MDARRRCAKVDRRSTAIAWRDRQREEHQNKTGDDHGHERHDQPDGGEQSGRENRSPQASARRQCERSRRLAGEGRGAGRAQAHHRRGRSRSRSRDHHLSRRQREIARAAVREHQGPSRPSRALQHDRLQPVALLPDDRRAAGRSSARGGADPAAQARAQDAAQGGPARAGDLQPEHRRGRRDRHPHVPGAADVAARRRHVSRHRRCRRHQDARRPGASTSAPTG